MLDSLEEHLLVGEIRLNLSAALLEDLSHDLRAKLICRVCEDVGHFQNNTVEELRILQRRRVASRSAVGSESRTTVHYRRVWPTVRSELLLSTWVVAHEIIVRLRVVHIHASCSSSSLRPLNLAILSQSACRPTCVHLLQEDRDLVDGVLLEILIMRV